MSTSHPLAGVYVAAVTPLQKDSSPDYDAIPALMEFYAGRGCHGALLLGTTGEGPSFAANERQQIWQQGTKVREKYPDFRLLAGTGTPSLEETASYTKHAFDLGYDGVVVLPPYYFRTASDEGLFDWYDTVIQKSVPSDGHFLGYHIPKVSGVGLDINLLKRLKDTYPDKFAGLKDSTGSQEHAELLSNTFGGDILALVGNDRLLSSGLEMGLSGCITALANLVSPQLRKVWDDFQNGDNIKETQTAIDRHRDVLDKYPPAAAFLKAMLHRVYDLPRWGVRAPLLPISNEDEEAAVQEIASLATPV
ncbi:MAG: dihydrodipicolinate synthase family protein [Chloroflexi bacterium]|nr:MAG: dihydrodipicolinate synthase family protein [Chloroflexota bacterium]MBL1195981.1 dihydrodipicolinate synthase family protein [Chloroflexota bacterium]NOH13275.1 dihydrodipicolinate synthase family protein [Chloroflexota bacterium]